MCGFISGFSILFHWSMCVFLCQYDTILIDMLEPYCFDSLEESLKSEIVMPRALLFFLKIVFAIQGLLWLHTHVQVGLLGGLLGGTGLLLCSVGRWGHWLVFVITSKGLQAVFSRNAVIPLAGAHIWGGL